MSTIGSGISATSPLAGSFAGAQRADGELDQRKADAAERSGVIASRQRSDRAANDVDTADLSSERDADGRETGVTARQVIPPPPSHDDPAELPPPPDALGERGTRLDLSG